MVHLFKHSDGKFDIALIRKGRVIVFSNQHYSKKLGCYGAIVSMMDTCFFNGNQSTYSLFQDDSLKKPTVFEIDENGRIKPVPLKPSKPYIPSKRKK